MTVEDPVTMGDLFERHNVDRPDCPGRTRLMLDWIKGETGPEGYRCRVCGWEWRNENDPPLPHPGAGSGDEGGS